MESILRQRLAARGHIVEQQVFVPGVGRVDARVDGVLFVEVDGFRFHGDAASFERDRARDAALTLSGARQLRLSARQIIDDPQAAVRTIEAVLELLETEENRGGRAA
ncbi:endonuclease domain-containing protein [Leifsonia sp. RAF41]|uniref:endonuclease domain-containing protein n=1 Tax=Leifsonia sp. RAF41 TaxID=3233056 RepID=UPI003F945687